MTSYQRTQVYLDPEDHRRLKRLATERGQAMTDLVREAVARYVADELVDEVPSVDEMMAELEADPLYDGLPPGADGFVARMGARAAAAEVESAPRPDAIDRDVADALLDRHTEHVQRWMRRRGPAER